MLLPPLPSHHNGIHAVKVLITPVIAQFILDKQGDDNHHSKTNRQSENIDKSIAFMPSKITKHYL